MGKFASVSVRVNGNLFWEGQLMVGRESEVVRSVSAFCFSSGLFLASPFHVSGSASDVGSDVPTWWTLSGRTFVGEPVVAEVRRV